MNQPSTRQFEPSIVEIDPSWIDHNGHLNLPYYSVLFAAALEAHMEKKGLGPSYTAQGKGTLFAAESHVRYLREVYATDSLELAVRLLKHDTRRLQWWAEMRSLRLGVTVATFEMLSLHVDQRMKKVAPFPSDLMERIGTMQAFQARIPIPKASGRVWATASA